MVQPWSTEQVNYFVINSNSSSFFYAKEYFLTLLGPASIKKAIEEAEKLSESLKLRLQTFYCLHCLSMVTRIPKS